jgi:NAD(P)-dependent dehydrogenase (short-subunit alcohol dehydrogenase family)
MSRVVVITGGGTGVGAACARLLASRGDRVFIIGRRREPLMALADDIGAQALVGDAASGECWQSQLLPAILQQAGRIDCLVCSAGGMGMGRITEMTSGVRRWTATSTVLLPAPAPACRSW